MQLSFGSLTKRALSNWTITECARYKSLADASIPLPGNTAEQIRQIAVGAFANSTCLLTIRLACQRPVGRDNAVLTRPLSRTVCPLSGRGLDDGGLRGAAVRPRCPIAQEPSGGQFKWPNHGSNPMRSRIRLCARLMRQPVEPTKRRICLNGLLIALDWTRKFDSQNAIFCRRNGISGASRCNTLRWAIVGTFRSVTADHRSDCGRNRRHRRHRHDGFVAKIPRRYQSSNGPL